MRSASVFLAHGSPMSALGGDAHAAALKHFGQRHKDARGIVIVSAHWQTPAPIRATSWEHAPLVYDFGGFPEELYRITYPAPGDPALAARIPNAVPELKRGLDHGAWVPLRLAWPDARIPVVQVSLPGAGPQDVFNLGRALRPLRDEGVLVIGSGGIVHNLGLVHFSEKNSGVDPWAAEFDRWVAARVASEDVDSLLSYRTLAPEADLAAPTPEHFDPIFVALGAAWPGERLETIYEGFHYGNLSMRSLGWIPA
ncbi:MAG TPA: class III extradiol ring-cleavage dioxygenase [Candidatus Acidoferrales bacterium]|nr:class III extradiol ring-cleavage dioxygenase [Candidatus Acidoferrales bacterium]